MFDSYMHPVPIWSDSTDLLCTTENFNMYLSKPQVLSSFLHIFCFMSLFPFHVILVAPYHLGSRIVFGCFEETKIFYCIKENFPDSLVISIGQSFIIIFARDILKKKKKALMGQLKSLFLVRILQDKKKNK